MSDILDSFDKKQISWRVIKKSGLDLEYGIMFPISTANQIFHELENNVEYFTGDLTKIKVFGKAYALPRQQVAFGDSGITYKYSGLTVPALPWIAPIEQIRDLIFKLKGIKYNFVLVNKYRNGKDHIGEHRDNEPELDPKCPIASVSFGLKRPFVLKHKDARKQGKNKVLIPSVKITLEHGSILFMNPPTNEIWYHSLPARKNIRGVRINLTFRKMIVK